MKVVWAILAVVTALFGWSRLPEARRKALPKTATAPVSSAGSGVNVLLITIDTLRADHLGAYGYRRDTSPRMDALAREGIVFEQAYTYLPKTRGSFVMMMTGLRPSQNGYSKQHPMILGDNPTIAAALKEAGYETIAVVDNANVAAKHGYALGFDRYRETWTEVADPPVDAPGPAEMERTRLITDDAVAYLAKPPVGRPFFLWLHYVNPHAPYTPPAPFDTRFLDGGAESGPVLRPVKGGFHGGVHHEWEVPGKRLGYYVAQYDGEIATVDQEVGKVLDALAAGPAANTMVIVSSDHGESLGEHDYYFDHGADVFDPCLRIPLIVRMPGAPAGLRTDVLASTLDFFPTILDSVKAPYPRDPRGFGFAGRSLLAEIQGRSGRAPATLIAQNEHHATARFDARLKTVAMPHETKRWTFSFFDRAEDPAEVKDLAPPGSKVLRAARQELELFLDGEERIWGATRTRVAGHAGPKAASPRECEQLRALGYTGIAGCD